MPDGVAPNRARVQLLNAGWSVEFLDEHLSGALARASLAHRAASQRNEIERRRAPKQKSLDERFEDIWSASGNAVGDLPIGVLQGGKRSRMGARA